jgi:hypothetical protein
VIFENYFSKSGTIFLAKLQLFGNILKNSNGFWFGTVEIKKLWPEILISMDLLTSNKLCSDEPISPETIKSEFLTLTPLIEFISLV